MKDLMKTNVYDVGDSLIIVGSCLKRMQPKAFEQLSKLGDNIYDLCLEEVHINMAVSKICGMIARTKINKMITRYICKNLKRHFKKIDKEDKKYQKIFNKKQKDKEKMRKNQEEKPKKQKKWLNFFKNLFKKGQRTAKCADSNNNS